MTETLSSAIHDIHRRYLAIWSEPDPVARRAEIASLWAPGGVEFVDGAQFRGLDEIDARITHAHDAFIAGGQYTLTGGRDLSVHGDMASFTIHLTEASGEAAWTARVFLVIGSDGRVAEDYQIQLKLLQPA